jgi:alpha-beta hydrolase superfamily lysophospholipase
LVDPEGSRRWAIAAPASMLQAQEFPGLYHEIFNETPELAAPVWASLNDWLRAF